MSNFKITSGWHVLDYGELFSFNSEAEARYYYDRRIKIYRADYHSDKVEPETGELALVYCPTCHCEGDFSTYEDRDDDYMSARDEAIQARGVTL